MKRAKVKLFDQHVVLLYESLLSFFSSLMTGWPLVGPAFFILEPHPVAAPLLWLCLARPQCVEPTSSNICRVADKLQAEIHLRLHIFLHRIMLEQIIGEDHERLEREYI